MTKSTRVIIIIIVFIVAAGLSLIPLFMNLNQESRIVDKNVIPPIDASRPAITETATFAMG